jgi:hypothetical protein
MRRIAILAAVFALAACNNDSTSPTVSLTGNYSLRTVNGSSLPVTLLDGSILTSDVLTLFNDGTFTDNAQFSDGTVEVEQGFYSANNGSINFQDLNSNFTFAGSLSGAVLTEIIPVSGGSSLTEVYVKQ